VDLSEILAESIDCQYSGPAWRSVYTCDPTQNLFDDLVPLEQQSQIYTLVEKSKSSNEKSANSNKEKPFHYLPEEHSFISWPPEPWTPGRWGDGSNYAVWYGALTEKTSLLEVIHHLRKKATSDFEDSPKTQEVVFHREELLAEICATRIADLRKCNDHFTTVLTSEDYTLCNRIGNHFWTEKYQGLFSTSVRDFKGVNLSLFQKSSLISDKKIRIVRVCFGRTGSIKVTHREDITEYLFGKPNL
jgi:RES domain